MQNCKTKIHQMIAIFISFLSFERNLLPNKEFKTKKLTTFREEHCVNSITLLLG